MTRRTRFTTRQFQYRAIKKSSARFRRLKQLPLLRQLWLVKTWFFVVFLLLIPTVMFTAMLAERFLTTYYLVTGPVGGTYAVLGEPVVETLNSPGRLSRIMHMDFLPAFQARGSNGGLDNVHQINQGKAELGFVEDGIPTVAHKPPACATAKERAKAKQAKEVVRVQALMPLYKSPMHIVAGRDFPINDLSKLPRGSRVYMGPEGSATAVLAQLLLTHYGMCVVRVGSDWSFGKAAEVLKAGKVDVAFFLTGLKSSDALNSLSDTKRFKLLSVEHAEGLRYLYPYLHGLTIPASTYSGFEEVDIETVSTNTVMVASASLSAMEAYQILGKLSANIHEIVQDIPFNTAKLSDADPQKDLYFPLHEGAVRFYKRNPPFILNPQRLAAIGTYLTLLFALYKSTTQFMRNYLAQRLMDATARARSRQPLSKRQERHLADIKLLALELLRERRIAMDEYNRVNEYLKGHPFP